LSKSTLAIVLGLIFFLVILLGLSWWLQKPQQMINPVGQIMPTPTPKPLLKYSFPTLINSKAIASQITFSDPQAQNKEYNTYIFSYISDNKKITGQLNVPNLATPSAGFPVLVMLRGFVDPAIYQTGMGTKNAAAFFAKNGLVTLAPDFLGFGGSDAPAPNTIAARLEKPKNVVDLLVSLNNLPFINPEKLGLWAHSNGGQIALSVLEITGSPIPTSLWAPVSKSFPYSILYYTDESEDQGKELRKVVADFERDYDVFDFSIDRFWGLITAPIEVHQGTLDDAVPVAWSQDLVKAIKQKNQDITLNIYPGADHNLRPSWDQVVERDLTFFNKHFK
jgi:uncharacterized protein